MLRTQHLICGLLLMASGLAEYPAQSPSARPLAAKKAPALVTKAEERRITFAPGDSLEFRVSWNSFLTAATARLRTLEMQDFYGKKSLHFQATAQTIDPVRMLFALNDQFDSYSDAVDFTSRQFELYLSEKNKKETHILRMSTDGEAVQDGQSTVRVLPGTQDPLGFLFALRTVDWHRTNQIRVPVYDGKKLYDVQARVLNEKVEASVPAGNFTATRIQIRVFDRGRELTETKFWVWLANEESRRPVLIEASLPFGDLRVELTSSARR